LTTSFGRAHGIPLMLERRPQETAYKGKKTTHYTLHLNEAPGTAEAVKAVATSIDPDETPPEILDGEEVQAKPVVVEQPAKAKDDEGAKQSKEFLEGLKKDSKAELGVEGGKPVKSRAIDKEKAKIYPVEFPKFMAFCKKKLEEADLGDMYRDAFHLFSVTDTVKLSHDQKKQEDIRVYLEALLEEKHLVGDLMEIKI
jgi:hypothetical protein